MTDPGKPQPIDYRGPPIIRTWYVEDARDRAWRGIRILYRVGLFAILGPILIYVLPNYLLFGKLTSLGPEDFVAIVQGDPTRAVIAIKEYQRDTGHLPDQLENVEPKYLPKPPGDRPDFGEMNGAQYYYICEGKLYPHSVAYDLSPGAGGWSVHGPFANGPIPLPPVTLPATQP